MARLRDRFPHTLVLEHVRLSAAAPAADPRRRTGPVSDHDLATAVLVERFGRAVEPAEAALLEAAFAAAAAVDDDRVPVAAPSPLAAEGPAEGAVA
jgi:hypothetical protein